MSGEVRYLTNTSHQTTSAFFHKKNNGCTSGVFLLVLLNFFFVQKHQQRQTANVNQEIQQKSSTGRTDEQPIETTGVGDV